MRPEPNLRPDRVRRGGLIGAPFSHPAGMRLIGGADCKGRLYVVLVLTFSTSSCFIYTLGGRKRLQFVGPA